MNTTEKYVYDFIRRLIDQTEQAELEWHVTSGLELENLWNSPIEGTFFAEEDNPYGLKQDDYQPIIVTDDEKKQEDLQFLPFGETYWLSTGEDTWLYIVSYVNTKFWQPEHLDMYFLFQRYDENNYSHIIKKNVFSTKERNGTVVECFRTLYKQIGVYMKQLHLDSDVKDEIDAFMSRTDPEAHFKVSRNDSKTAINVDDEIPF